MNNVISATWTFLRIAVWKIGLMGSLLLKGAIQRISPNEVCNFNEGAKVNIGRTVRIHSGSKIKERKGSNVTNDGNFRINYYALLGMRTERKGAYERAAGFETPMGQYAPGVRINRTAATFCARFYMLTEMLGNPEEVCPLLKTREGRAWLSRYPKVSSLSKTLLCGKFLGYGDFVPAMTRLFLDETGKLYAETWLVVQEIGLAFDLDSRKPGEEYGLVFEIQRHPLIADGDALARVAARRGHTVLDARLNQCNKDLLGADDATAVFDVLDALGILTEGRVPTLEDIMKSYLESCVDVPAGGWDASAEG